MGSGVFGLIGIVIQFDHVAASESCDFPRWLSNPTAHIKDRHMLFDSDSVREVMFEASESLQKGLPSGNAVRMEGLRPSFLVRIGRNIIVAIHCCLSAMLKVLKHLQGIRW